MHFFHNVCSMKGRKVSYPVKAIGLESFLGLTCAAGHWT
jgi:hypothetical protein